MIFYQILMIKSIYTGELPRYNKVMLTVQSEWDPDVLAVR